MERNSSGGAIGRKAPNGFEETGSLTPSIRASLSAQPNPPSYSHSPNPCQTSPVYVSPSPCLAAHRPLRPLSVRVGLSDRRRLRRSAPGTKGITVGRLLLDAPFSLLPKAVTSCSSCPRGRLGPPASQREGADELFPATLPHSGNALFQVYLLLSHCYGRAPITVPCPPTR